MNTTVQKRKPSEEGSSNAGILFGVGTGPGDPEMMTLQALRVLQEADVIAVPTDSADHSMAFQTASAASPEILQKELLCLPFSMDPDPAVRQRSRQKNADAARAVLDEGKNIAFLTIGDPTIYSTFGYLYDLLGKTGSDSTTGYSVRIISGVPSFCGAAARLGIPLCCGEERLEILPGVAFGPDNSENADSAGSTIRSEAVPGVSSAFVSDSEEAPRSGQTAATRVIMKTGSQYPEIVRELRRSGADARMIVRATQPEEQQFHDPDHFPEETEYYSMIIYRNRNR